MDLLKLISENYSFSFSGRINILSKVSKQYLGAVIQSEGAIVNAKYLNLTGKKALASVLMELRSNKLFNFVSEPEVVSPSDIVFQMSESQFLKFKNDYFEQFDELNKLKPKGNIKLALDPLNFDFQMKFSKTEFDTLCSVLEFSLVEDIYHNSELLDFDITTALISLRKKGILKVVGFLKNGEI